MALPFYPSGTVGPIAETRGQVDSTTGLQEKQDKCACLTSQAPGLTGGVNKEFELCLVHDKRVLTRIYYILSC